VKEDLFLSDDFKLLIDVEILEHVDPIINAAKATNLTAHLNG
jgi:hypothetical protein